MGEKGHAHHERITCCYTMIGIRSFTSHQYLPTLQGPGGCDRDPLNRS